mgnify:CR=1 FL=1
MYSQGKSIVYLSKNNNLIGMISVSDALRDESKEVIEAKSNGKITIDIYPVGQIGDATQQCELLQNGGLEFAIVHRYDDFAYSYKCFRV